MFPRRDGVVGGVSIRHHEATKGGRHHLLEAVPIPLPAATPQPTTISILFPARFIEMEDGLREEVFPELVGDGASGSMSLESRRLMEPFGQDRPMPSVKNRAMLPMDCRMSKRIQVARSSALGPIRTAPPRLAGSGARWSL